MSRWFRFYDEALNDPKILKLSDKMHRVWVGILCIASKNNGEFPPLDDMALMLRMTSAKLDDAIKSLMVSGLIDQDGTILFPHNWDKRQFKSDVSNERVQRYRERKRNVTVAPPETETETETEKDAAPAAPILSIVPDVTPRSEAELEKSYFDRGKVVLGNSSGGMLKNLLKAKQNSVPLSRAAIEQASTKSDPREYIGAIIRGREENSGGRPGFGDEWG